MMSIHASSLDSSETDPSKTIPSMGDLEALKGVVKYPVRIKCATLGWNTFDQIIESAKS